MPFAARVHIIEARELKGVDDGGMSDPFVVVTCCGQKQETQRFEKCSAAVFDKLMMFDLNSLNQKQFQKGTIKIECYDYNAFTPNILIGLYNFGVGDVNMKPGHEYHNVWIGLLNPTLGFDMQGFVKVSISCVKGSESHTDHAAGEEEEDDGGDIASKVLLPQGVKMAPYRLSCYIYRGKDLPKMDLIGWCDGFIKLIYSGATIASEVFPNNANPEWKEELQLPVMTPTMADAIEVALFDDDAGISEDYIGGAFYSWKELMDRVIIGPHWCHLYGWPDDADDEVIAKLGNTKPIEYRGQVLLGFEVEEDKNARIGKKNCPTAEEPETVEYEFRLDLFQVGELPIEDTDVFVQFGLGNPQDENNYKDSQIAELVGNSSDHWLTERKLGQLTLRSRWPAIKKSNCYLEKQVPDLFVNLMKGPTMISDAKRIGYLRFEYDLKKAKELMKDDIQWFSFIKDPFTDMVEEGEIPGFAQLRVQFGERKKLPRRGGWPATRKADYLLRAHIYQGKNLPAADAEGTSDAYLKVRMAGKVDQTEIIYVTCAPRWYQTIELDVSVPTNQDLLPNTYIMLYDWNEWLPDAYLGRFSVPGEDIAAKYKPEVDEDDWHPVQIGDSVDDTKGHVLATFQLISKKDIPNMKEKGTFGPHDAHEDGLVSIYPEHKDCIFEMLIVGVRDLESYNFFDCTDPWLEIDIGDRENTLRTDQGETPNASWLQMLQLECELPIKTIFSPTVNGRIYDNRMMGDVHVGSFTIPVQLYTTWNEDEFEEVLPEEIAFDDEEEEEEEELTIPQDYLPMDWIEMNETCHETFRFDTQVKGGQIGTRTVPDTKKIQIGDGDDGAEPKKKHPVKDRPCYEKNWEVTPEGFNRDNRPPCHVYDVMRGGGGGGGLFGFLSMSTPEREVGKLKCRCRAYIVDSPEHTEDPTVEDKWANMGRDKKMLLRFYLIRGINLMAQDDNGFSDPFVNVMVSNHAPIMDKDRTLRKETLQPNFYTYYEFKDVKMPGDHSLTVEVWDEDFFGDDLIGKAKVDLEDRHYTESWYKRDIEAKTWQPKEWLPLFTSTSPIPQGRIECWIDFLEDKEAGQIPIIKLEPPRGDPWEFRVICWKVNDLNFRDKTSVDLFCSGMVEFKDVEDEKMKRLNDRQDTDTQWFMEAEHFGSFHWRWKFDVKIPSTMSRLVVQTWDLELLTPNDAMCEANIQLGSFFKAAEKKQERHACDLDTDLTHPNFKGIQGNVELSLELLTEKEAEEDPAEEGRCAELMSREGMYDYYRPPGAFPAFGLMAILKAKLKPLKKYCIYCCAITLCIAIVAVVAMSDVHLKDHIEPLPTSRYSVLGLTGVQWTWNEKAQNEFGLHGVSTGVIAQDVEAHFPWLILTYPDGYKRVNYGGLELMIWIVKLQNYIWSNM